MPQGANTAVSEPPPPVTNGVQPDERNERDSITQSHMKNLKTFSDKFKKTIPAILEQVPQYDSIKTILLYWKGGDPDMSGEATSLETVFSSIYGYKDTEHYPIPAKDPVPAFNAWLSGRVQAVSNRNQNNLLVLYYGGHGFLHRRKNAKYWMPFLKTDGEMNDSDEEEDDGPASIGMDVVRTLLKPAICDVLLIFDCCYALAMLGDDFSGKRRTWLLAASGKKERARGVGNTYTSALKQELERLGKLGGVSCTQLNDTIVKTEKMVVTYKLKTTPHIQCYSNSSSLGPIALTRSDRTGISRNPQDLSSDERMLIKIAFTNPSDELRHDLWKFWFSSRPPNFNEVEMAVWKQTEVVGFFPSNSTMLLLTMPVSLWAFFPHDPAMECIGMVRSRTIETVVPPKSGKADITVPGPSSSKRPIEDSSVLQPRKEEMSLPESENGRKEKDRLALLVRTQRLAKSQDLVEDKRDKKAALRIERTSTRSEKLQSFPRLQGHSWIVAVPQLAAIPTHK